MAPKLATFCIFAFLFLSLESKKSVATKKTHKEILSVQKLLDELILRLSLNLKLQQEKAMTAAAAQKDATEQQKTVAEDLTKVYKIHSLLGQLYGTHNASAPCDHHFSIVDFVGKRPVRLHAVSDLPANYTVSFDVNHMQLIDQGLSQANGNDLRVFYQSQASEEPVQIDRVVSGLGTTNATVSFKLQAPLPSNAVNQNKYALVFGSKSAGRAMSNPEGVYLFYDDFSDSNLDRKWKMNNFGQWSVKSGKLFGVTGITPTGDDAEIGIYAKDGFGWEDYEVDLDFLEATSAPVEYPGPFLRVRDPSTKSKSAWWFEYKSNHKDCTMRPYQNNKDGSWAYRGTLPTPLTAKWFHFRYRVQGQSISHWADGHVIHDNVAVASQWKIKQGSLGFGCYNKYTLGCRSYYDNIRIRLLVPSPPRVLLGDPCRLQHHAQSLLGSQEKPADSCKQMHDASLLDGKPLVENGMYWVKTRLNGKAAVQTYCDMNNGGWTLVGKLSGSVGNIYDKWLVQNRNVKGLKSPSLRNPNTYSCLDARVLAVHFASRVMFSSSGDDTSGIGSKWVSWELPRQREVGTLWNHAVGYNRVKSASEEPVTVTSWNGATQVCYQNKYGIMRHQDHGGSYPTVSFNNQGNTKTNDYCMALGVMTAGSTAHGWTQNRNGYDSPESDADWPNRAYNHQSPYVTIWLK